MEKFKFNVCDLGDKISIGIKPNFDIQKWKWFNLIVDKRHIKDKSLDDKNLFDF